MDTANIVVLPVRLGRHANAPVVCMVGVAFAQHLVARTMSTRGLRRASMSVDTFYVK